MNLRLILGLVLGAAAALLAPAEPVRIYLANDDHTDYLWTADAETYDAVFVDMLDYYLRLADDTATNAAPYQSRFNADGSYWLWQYERRKSPAEFERLMARVKDGHISAPLTTLVSCYGGQPLEAVLRGMYYAGRLERRFQHRFTLAVAMENQSLPLGLASLWAGAGAKYSWRGVCGCASRFSNQVLARRPHEIYWYTGQDGGRVLMKWHSLADGNNRSIGGYAEAFDPVSAVGYLDTNAAFLSRYTDPSQAGPYRVRGAFGFGWDALNRKTGQPYGTDPQAYPTTEHFHTVAQAQSNGQRQVIASNEEDFFQDFEKAYGAGLPTESVTYGNEWELYSASMAETSARVRRSVEKLRGAELMAVLVSLKRPEFLRGREEARDRAFTDLGLYWEHNWTADGPVPRERRAAWQESLADEIEHYVDSLHAEGATQLGELIQSPKEARDRFFVLNPLGWSRTAPADYSYDGPADVHVVDVAGDVDVPHQIVSVGGVRLLRILANEVPAAGYRVFEIRRGTGIAPTRAAASVELASGKLENARLRLVVEPDGAIASLIDKAHPAVDLAGTVDGLKLNDFAGNDASGGALEVENSGPVSVTLKCMSGAGRQHVTRVTLYRDADYAEVRNEITENLDDLRHWAFSLNLASPDVHTEEVGAIIRAKTKANGGDYADTHARYDYLTLNHFADITDGANARGVTLANADCAFARLGRSTPDALDTATPQILVLAGGQVDGPGLGIRGQNGATRFLQRFGLRPHGAYDPVLAMRFGMELQNPLVTGRVRGAPNGAYPATTYSLLKISHPAVLLWALKPHEDGLERGVVARLWNLAPEPAHVRLTTAVPLTGAARLSHIETRLESLSLKKDRLETTVGARRIETYALELPRSRDH